MVAKPSPFAMFRILTNALLMVVLALPFVPGAAPAAELFTNADDALSTAAAYSDETGGVGVVISFGTQNTITADELGASFGKEIARRGHSSQYFVIDADHVGVSVRYRIGSWDSGWLTVANAAAEMDSVIEKAALQVQIVTIERRMAKTRAQLIEKYGENYLEEMEKRWLQDEKH